MTLRGLLAVVCLSVALVLTGCRTSRCPAPPGGYEARLQEVPSFRSYAPSMEERQRILALDPGHVSATDVQEVLALAPAPRIIAIHGGLLPLEGSLVSFAEFLVGMGYPRKSIENPRDGTCAFGYYVHSRKISGLLAWYYEREGLRPILIGHSQGGFLVVKVLHRLAGDSSEPIPLWNPLTWEAEGRFEFVDPLTGQSRTVVGLKVPYATAVLAGGLGRALPNQWEMNGRLRRVPDSVEEFTGFQKGWDALGGDFLGFGASNNYKAMGKAVVRNVRLPSSYSHTHLPRTDHLLKDQQIRSWIDHYSPQGGEIENPELDVKFGSDSTHVLWAADVWYSIKKHWVLELQRLIRTQHCHG